MHDWLKLKSIQKWNVNTLKVYGIYTADTPGSFFEKNTNRMWARNNFYWRTLKRELNFPIGKVKGKQIRDLAAIILKESRLKECTNYYNNIVETIDLSLAKPRHRREWMELGVMNCKTMQTKIMGFDPASWNNWASSEFAQTPFDKLTKEQQSFLTSSLDCSPKSWNNKACGLDHYNIKRTWNYRHFRNRIRWDTIIA